MNLEICNHPAQARHPATGKPLFDDGVPVPLFPNQRAIKLDGYVIAYVSPTLDVFFLGPIEKVGQAVVDAATELVQRELGEPGSVKTPLAMEKIDADDSISTNDEP